MPENSEIVILVVDDEPSIRKLLHRTLEAEGYRVISANSGGEGLKKIRENRPHLVITDVVMPVVSGHDLIRATRAEFPETKFLKITGYHAPTKVQDGIPHLRKPFSPSEILSKIESLMNGSRED